MSRLLCSWVCSVMRWVWCLVLSGFLMRVKLVSSVCLMVGGEVVEKMKLWVVCSR